MSSEAGEEAAALARSRPLAGDPAASPKTLRGKRPRVAAEEEPGASTEGLGGGRARKRRTERSLLGRALFSFSRLFYRDRRAQWAGPALVVALALAWLALDARRRRLRSGVKKDYSK